MSAMPERAPRPRSRLLSRAEELGAYTEARHFQLGVVGRIAGARMDLYDFCATVGSKEATRQFFGANGLLRDRAPGAIF